MWGRRVFRWLKLAVVFSLALLLLAPEWPAYDSEEYQLLRVVGQRSFDFLGWELGAFGAKLDGVLADGQAYMSDEASQELVLAYLADVRRAQQLESAVVRIYSDPEVTDPAAAAAETQAELDDLRQSLEERQILVEAVLQEQVSSVLVGEGFGILGHSWPPVMMHTTELPTVLVVSPRDRIEQTHQYPLLHGITTETKEQLESAVLEDVDLSGLVVPVAGLGTYPAMVRETTEIGRLAEIAAHEWTHHWLTLQPLGFNYAFDPQLRIINETVASIAGDELGLAVLERFYPEQVPSPVEPAAPAPAEPEPAFFDYRAEMAATRRQVDQLLAEGKVDEAETYMEERRQLFVSEGYMIRKINQAFFAFYGAYADVPGERGDDPIGPLVQKLREESPSLQAFLERVGPITSFEELRQIAG